MVTGGSKASSEKEELISSQSKSTKIKFANSFTSYNFITKNEARGNTILPKILTELWLISYFMLLSRVCLYLQKSS